MPKKIADLKRKAPNQKAPREKIIDFLREHPEEGFSFWELGQGTGLIPKVDSFGTLAGFLIGTALAGGSTNALEFPTFRNALNDLVKEGVVEHNEALVLLAQRRKRHLDTPFRHSPSHELW